MDPIQIALGILSGQLDAETRTEKVEIQAASN